MADKAGIAATAERQREGIEQNRFAGAGLAGQDREPPIELDIEPFDQDDVADRQTRQHARIVPGSRSTSGPILAFACPFSSHVCECQNQRTTSNIRSSDPLHLMESEHDPLLLFKHDFLKKLPLSANQALPRPSLLKVLESQEL